MALCASPIPTKTLNVQALLGYWRLATWRFLGKRSDTLPLSSPLMGNTLRVSVFVWVWCVRSQHLVALTKKLLARAWCSELSGALVREEVENAPIVATRYLSLLSDVDNRQCCPRPNSTGRPVN